MRTEAPPLVPGLPLIGNTLGLIRQHWRPFVVDAYRRFGPVFRFRAVHFELTVLAGPKANELLIRDSEGLLSLRPNFEEFIGELGTERFIILLEGDDHRQMRHLLQKTLSKNSVQSYIPQMIEVTREAAQRWRPGDPIRVLPATRRIVLDQLGLALANQRIGQSFDAFEYFFSALIHVFSIHDRPRWWLRRRRYKDAKAEVMRFAREVLGAHRRVGESRAHDMVDDLLEFRNADGSSLTESDLLANCLIPYFGGLHTSANTTAFLIYEVLKNPNLHARLQAEADRFFRGRSTAPESLAKLQDFEAAVLETLRLHPATPSVPRTAVKDFEFEGSRIKAGCSLFVHTTLMHDMEEHFPDPARFDIDRFLAPRNEHLKMPGAFAPFSLGPHMCLGAPFAQMQVMMTVATLLHEFDLELDPPDYDLRERNTPIPSPEPKFAIRVRRRRRAPQTD